MLEARGTLHGDFSMMFISSCSVTVVTWAGVTSELIVGLCFP